MQANPKPSSAASTAPAVVFTTSRGLTATEVTPLEIARRHRYAASGDVLRSRTNDASHLPDSDPSQRGVGKLADPDAEVEPLVYQ